MKINAMILNISIVALIFASSISLFTTAKEINICNNGSQKLIIHIRKMPSKDAIANITLGQGLYTGATEQPPCNKVDIPLDTPIRFGISGEFGVRYVLMDSAAELEPLKNTDKIFIKESANSISFQFYNLQTKQEIFTKSYTPSLQ